MADAPKENPWGPLEIIIVLILAMGLISKITGQPVTPVVAPLPVAQQKNGQAVGAVMDRSSPFCGLIVTRPLSLEKVRGAVTLVGKVSGCNWNATQTVALQAQVIDSYGAPLSSLVTIPPSATSAGATSFAGTVVITGNTATAKGFLLLIPASTPTDLAQHTVTVRIPIRFAN